MVQTTRVGDGVTHAVHTAAAQTVGAPSDWHLVGFDGKDGSVWTGSPGRSGATYKGIPVEFREHDGRFPSMTSTCIYRGGDT